MPINIIGAMLIDGPDVLPGWSYIKAYGPAVAAIGALKYYFGGSQNTWERDMHGKVFIITGGTSGVGAHVAYELASKGAQVILLCRKVEDQWLVDFIDDLRESTNNFLIYAEEGDLSSLHSIRKFATKWLDNSPPRRLDGIICCAAESVPPYVDRQITIDGVERQIGVNYLGHFHLLTLLSPSIRVQPPDRDVRVVLATCASQSLGEIDPDLADVLWQNKRYPKGKPWKVYGTSKLMLSMFSKEFQKRISLYERSDKTPCNVRTISVNPGVMRTASTRRFLSFGSVFGLIVYWLLFPIWFILLKSGSQGAQSFLYSIYSGEFAQIEGGKFVHECRIVSPSRKELANEDLQGSLYDKTEKLIEQIELQSAKERKKNELKNGKKKGADKNEESKEANLTTSSGAKIVEDVYTMPKTPEELEEKLNILRNDLSTAAKKRSGKSKRKS
ncbi:uncharacterized oxidoreductase [[Candida] railenensis]|uniref:Uncharacterized oxidoreductase n=1 Tax=[Candida] railenensis TaxID=45579 RepID=A0A9P0QTR0_9ASCO|nr:uncharacterized oxidoreductase [[Candida] railenensis]